MKKRERLILRLGDGWNLVAIHDAILETRMRGSEKLLLGAAVSHANTGGGLVAVSVRRYAHLASVNKDTVAPVFERHERRGLIAIVERPRRKPMVIDLSPLPAGLVRLLSEPEGQPVSEGKGQALSEPEGQSDPISDASCPNSGDSARPSLSGSEAQSVPSDRTCLSEQRGPKGSGKEHLKGHSGARAREAQIPFYDSSTKITDALLDELETDTELASRQKSAVGTMPRSYVDKWQSDPDFFERVTKAAYARDNRNHGRKPPGAIQHEKQKRSSNGVSAGVAALASQVGRRVP